jgi:hypothetical protein
MLREAETEEKFRDVLMLQNMVDIVNHCDWKV